MMLCSLLAVVQYYALPCELHICRALERHDRLPDAQLHCECAHSNCLVQQNSVPVHVCASGGGVDSHAH
jgi:hypothetical protein